MHLQTALKLSLFTSSMLLATVAMAGITATAGDARSKPRADTNLDVTENNNGVRGMEEREYTNFDASPDFGLSTITTAQTVSCYLLHLDPITAPVNVLGQFQFNREIIGVITDTATLEDFDSLCSRPPMDYPPAGTLPLRGMENSPFDNVQVLQDANGAWTRIEIDARVVQNMDQVRVITCESTTTAANCSDLADSIGWGALQMP